MPRASSRKGAANSTSGNSSTVDLFRAGCWSFYIKSELFEPVWSRFMGFRSSIIMWFLVFADKNMIFMCFFVFLFYINLVLYQNWIVWTCLASLYGSLKLNYFVVSEDQDMIFIFLILHQFVYKSKLDCLNGFCVSLWEFEA